MAAPEIKTRTTMRKSEVVLATASFEKAGSSYATAIVVGVDTLPASAYTRLRTLVWTLSVVA